ncbi:MAG: hypothetical protein ACO1N3_04750 [Gammaproteobacteria bacterium]
MKLIKLLPLLFLSLNTMAMATSDSMDSDWDIHCDEDECAPKTSQTKQQVKKVAAFSSYSYKKIKREIAARHPKVGIFVGPTINKQGQAQDVPVLGCLGDSLSVSRPHVTGGIVGLAIYADSLGFEMDNYSLKYAFSTYYLSPTTVQGEVTQEQLVTNLNYSYKLTNVATYAGLRLINLMDGKRCNLTFDVGVGVNQVSTNFFIETPKIAIALPDNAYRSNSKNQFSFMAGTGFQIQNVLGKSPLGCGYTFLYLGEGEIPSINPRMPSSLTTGKNYANAIMCSVQLG